jgi:predicted phage terminase large subunit-like protein
LIITYGDDLSEEIGIQIRRLIKEWGGFFNVYLSSHTASKRKISFQDSDGRDYTGKIEVLGYKGAITGKTADIIIIDDLIKGPEDALSPSQNKKIVDFYLSAIYTRLFEHSELIIVSTRWSKTDLTGHLLEHSKEPWAVYIKKAIDDDNRALWPERFSLQRLQVIREEQGPFWWSALYLQEPEELKGDVFEGEFIQLPSSQFRDMEMERIVRYWDRAATEPKTGTDPDYTVGLLMALLKERINFNNKPLNQYLVLDVARFRGTPLENEQRILRTAECDGTGVEIYMEQEPGSLAKDSIYNYKRNILIGFKFRGIPSTGSKYIRAIDVAAKVEQGHVRFLGGDYLGDLFLEMRAFPYGAHDDQIDALSGAFNILKKTRRATVYV